MVDLLELADLAEESIYLKYGTTSLGLRHDLVVVAAAAAPMTPGPPRGAVGGLPPDGSHIEFRRVPGTGPGPVRRGTGRALRAW